MIFAEYAPFRSMTIFLFSPRTLLHRAISLSRSLSLSLSVFCNGTALDETKIREEERSLCFSANHRARVYVSARIPEFVEFAKIYTGLTRGTNEKCTTAVIGPWLCKGLVGRRKFTAERCNVDCVNLGSIGKYFWKGDVTSIFVLIKVRLSGICSRKSASLRAI